MNKELHLVTNAYMGKVGEEFQFRCNLYLDDVVALEDRFNSAFQTMTGQELDKIVTFNEKLGCVLSVKSDRISDRDGYLSFQTNADTMSGAINTKKGFKDALGKITNTLIGTIGSDTPADPDA